MEEAAAAAMGCGTVGWGAALGVACVGELNVQRMRAGVRAGEQHAWVTDATAIAAAVVRPLHGFKTAATAVAEAGPRKRQPPEPLEAVPEVKQLPQHQYAAYDSDVRAFATN